MPELEITERDRAVLLRDAEYILRNLEDAEDVVQDALMRAWLHREQFDGRSSSRTYLRSCVRNRSLEFLRGRKVGISLDAMPGGERERIGAQSLRLDEAIDARREVERAFRFLRKRSNNATRRRHMLIVIRYANGMSHREIARELGTTVNTSKVIVHRFRTMLRHAEVRR